jgi:vacuolar iron transporter family protein
MARVDDARKAFKEKDMAAVKAAHAKDAIAHSEHKPGKGKYVGDMVYGALDGTVTTFAVVSGVHGANLSSSVILILGFANLLGDGLSMAIGNYLGTKSEIEYIKQERKREEWEIENYPKGEIEEIREIFMKKGFKGKDLERAVEVVTSDKKVWVDTMMLEELGLTSEDKTPFLSGLATFIAFVVAGLMPLLAFVISLFYPMAYAFEASIVLTAAVLFTAGALRTLVTGRNWFKSGFEMLFVGGIAAVAAYLVGFFLRGIGA